MKPAIIIPTYNEKENIKELVSKINKLKIKGLIMVVVDDNSPDGTGKITDKLAKRLKSLYVVHRSAKLGLGTAYIAGFKFAFKKGCDVVVTMDADLSHDPKVIPQLLANIKKYDVVIGSRHVKKGKIIGFDLFRQVLSQSAQAFSRYWLGLPTYDSSSGFRAYRKSVIQTIKIDSIKAQGYSFLIEALYRCKKSGFTIKEVPIIFKVRHRGKSKLSEDEIYKAMRTVIRLRFNG